MSSGSFAPRWIPVEGVEEVHRRQIVRHGGLAGVRDPGALESALQRPRQRFAYGGENVDLADLAAAYAYGIVQNHPFVDGNKRVSFVLAGAFLQLNGSSLHASEQEVIDVWLRLAAGELSEADLAAWIRERTRPLADQ